MKLDPRRPEDLISTFLGVGLVPFAPGTWGSLAALPVAWLIHANLGPLALAAAALLVVGLGSWSAGATMRRTRSDDPGAIVIDEVAGQWLVLAAVPLDLLWYAAGFALFRLFDITKPWPVSWADRQVKGGLGVMLDDVIAAGYAAGVLLAVRALIPGGF
jgi:phosphatidylglycerophosphatase A